MKILRFSELSEKAQNKVTIDYFFAYNDGRTMKDRINLKEAYECCLDTDGEYEYSEEGDDAD